MLWSVYGQSLCSRHFDDLCYTIFIHIVVRSKGQDFRRSKLSIDSVTWLVLVVISSYRGSGECDLR